MSYEFTVDYEYRLCFHRLKNTLNSPYSNSDSDSLSIEIRLMAIFIVVLFPLWFCFGPTVCLPLTVVPWKWRRNRNIRKERVQQRDARKRKLWMSSAFDLEESEKNTPKSETAHALESVNWPSVAAQPTKKGVDGIWEAMLERFSPMFVEGKRKLKAKYLDTTKSLCYLKIHTLSMKIIKFAFSCTLLK